MEADQIITSLSREDAHQHSLPWREVIKLKDFLSAISLSNLWFISGWHMLLVRHPSNYPFYHWKVHPGSLYLAIVLNVLLLAFIFCAAMIMARRSQNRYVLKAAHCAFLVALLVPFFHIYSFIRMRDDVAVPWTLLASGLVIVGGVFFLVIYKKRSFARFAARLVLILAPLAGIWFYQAITYWVKSPSGASSDISQLSLAMNERSNTQVRRDRRVLWLVFDELDFRMSFVDRPASVKLPELDRLRRQSLFAVNAYPPAGDTVLSMPALFIGKLVSKAERISHNELMLTLGEENQAVPWSGESSVFTEARREGYATGLVGWYHPYCRILGNSLDTCSWEAAAIMNLQDPETVDLISSAEDRRLGSSMFTLVRRVMWTIPLLARLKPSKGELWRRHQTAELLRLKDRAEQLAATPQLGMVVVHLPIPHPLGIYDRSARDFSLDIKSSYLDNLALADRTLGEIRMAMEKRGLWDQTTVLVTSDHWLRAERVWRKNYLWNQSISHGKDEAVLRGEADHRVPFILKLAGQKQELTYEAPFNSTISRDLSLAILRGDLSTAEQIANWLDRNRTIGESPYVVGEK